MNRNATPNRFGKISRLRLSAGRRDGGGDPGGSGIPGLTVLEERSFTAPFKVMKPFRIRDGSLRVMVQAASAGMMSGDRQEMRISVGKGASLEVVSQSFEKIHKMDEGEARRKIDIDVGEHALLRFAPLPCIPFGGSAFSGELTADLAGENSRLIIRECLSCGRAASGERFAYRSYRNRVTVRRAGELVYRERAAYEPGSARDSMEGLGMYEGFTHSGTVLLFGFREFDAAAIRASMDSAIENKAGGQNLEYGVSTTAFGDIAVRMLGSSAESLMELMDSLPCGINP